MERMTRRDAVKTAGVLLGGAVVLGALPACRPEPESLEKPTGEKVVLRTTPLLLSTADEALLLDVADTLLPDTAASPGARQAGCGPAMNLLLTDCSEKAMQQKVVQGLTALRTRAPQFDTMPHAEREALLKTIDAEAVKAGDSHWFHALRDLSLRAYFSSEVGVTKALRYVREPGRYIGVVKLQPGQPAWA